MSSVNGARAAKPPRVLIVGPGALGQTLAESLSFGGAELAFLEPREKSIARRSFGYSVHRHMEASDARTSILFPFQIYRDVDAIISESWDYILLTLPADQLEGRLLSVLSYFEIPTRIVALQPGMGSLARLRGVMHDESLIIGSPNVRAYYYALPNASIAAGIAYDAPLGQKSLFSGEGAEQLVRTLKLGGLDAAVSDQALAAKLLSPALTLPYLAALELSGWSFERLRSGNLLAIARRAEGELQRACEVIHHVKLPDESALAHPALIEIGLNGDRRALPFAPARYFETYCARLRAESRILMSEYLELARKNRDSKAFESLIARVASARGARNKALLERAREQKKQKKRERRVEREARRTARR